MILDRTSIKSLLVTSGDAFQKILDENKDGIYIRTNTEQNMFDEDQQLGNDSIDLRIANYGYKMKSEYTYLNTLSEGDLSKYYLRVPLPQDGYLLKPGDLLFVPTYERIALAGNLIGRVTGRSVFARMGLSVHCTQDKFSSGINSVAGLQIKNNSPISLKIFPQQKLAQILIERTGDNRHPYTGAYCCEVEYTLPLVQDKDRAQYEPISRQIIKNQTPKKNPPWKNGKIDTSISISKLALSSITTVCMGVFGAINNITGLIISGVFNIIAMVLFTYIELKYQGERNVEKE